MLNVLGIILGLIGVVLAAIGFFRSKKVGSGKGLAVAGIILGALAIVIAVVVNSAFVDAVDEATSNTVESPPEGAGDSGDSPDDEGPSTPTRSAPKRVTDRSCYR